MEKKYVVVCDNRRRDHWSGELYGNVDVVSEPMSKSGAYQRAKNFQYDADYAGYNVSYTVREAIVSFKD